MRKFTVMTTVVSFVVLTAGFAVADISIENGNNNSNTNTTTVTNTSTSNATGGNANANGGNATVEAALPTVGFVGLLAPGTVVEGKDWRFYYSKIYSRLTVEEIEDMSYGFHFSDLWPTKWGGRVQFTKKGKPLPPNKDDIVLMSYWPLETMNPGDSVLGIAIVNGEADWTDEAFIAEAEKACKEKTGTRRVAIAYSEARDGITTGLSVGTSGLTSQMVGDGAAAFAAGGMIGRTRTHMDRITNIKALCMNDGPADLFVQSQPVVQPAPVVAPPVAKPESAPKAECDIEAIKKRIKDLEWERTKCTTYCFNNLTLNYAIGDAYIDLYTCTGNMEYLRRAIDHYDIADRNYHKGKDISAHQAEADGIMAQIYYNKAGCILLTQGKKAAMKYKAAKNLERIPTGFVR